MFTFKKITTITILFTSILLIGAGCGSNIDQASPSQDKESTSESTSKQGSQMQVLNLGETAKSKVLNISVEKVAMPNKYQYKNRTATNKELNRGLSRKELIQKYKKGDKQDSDSNTKKDEKRLFLAKIKIDNNYDQDLTNAIRIINSSLLLKLEEGEDMNMRSIDEIEDLSQGSSETFWVQPRPGFVKKDPKSIVFEFQDLPSWSIMPDQIETSNTKWSFSKSEIQQGGTINID